MKKPKIGFGEGGFQGFMARHVEKCVLVVVILLMAYFIYSGSGATALEDKNLTREKLKQDAASADSEITTSSWSTVAESRTPKLDVLREIREQSNPVDSRFYATRAWDPQLVPRLSPRRDPDLFPAENLVVTSLHGPLVLYGADPDEAPVDPLEKYDVVLGGTAVGGSGSYGMPAEMGPAAYPNEGEKSKTKKGKDKEKSTYPSYPGGAGYPGAGGGSSKRSRTRPGNSSSSSSSSSSEESTMPSGYGSYGMAGKKTRSISPEATLGVRGTPGAELRPAYANVITASVPYGKQWDAYRDAFSNAPGGQDPVRDIPGYLAVWVKRLDVTDDPSIDPASVPITEWKQLKLGDLQTMEALYAAMTPEISDPEAIDQRQADNGAFNGLTHPVPPFLLTDLIPALTHPDIPRASSIVEEYEEEEVMPGTVEGEGGDIPIDSMEGEASMEGGRGPRGYPSAPRGGGAGPRGYPSSGGAGGRPGSMPRMPGATSGSSSGGRGSYGAPRMPRGAGAGSSMGSSSMGSSSAGSRGYPRGMGGMAGGEGGMGSGMDMETYRPVAKKLVRYVDFDVKPGRKYRYIMQLVLYDPNRPADPSEAPDMSTLDEEARKRIKRDEAAEKEKGARAKYYVMTDWSSPSEIATPPSSEQFYAGPATRPGTSKIAGVDVVNNEPQAKVLTVQWDDKLGVFAPAELTVLRGAVLNARTDVEVIHPILGDLRKIPGYKIRTEGVVLDMTGGETLPGSGNDKEPQKAPGETLILDAHGNMVITDEATDIEGYRKYIFPEPKEEETAAADGAGPMGEGMAPGYPAGYGPQGYPGGKGGKGGKKQRGGSSGSAPY